MNEGVPHVVLLTAALFIPASHSLKTKRRVLKSLKDRVRARFNVSVAEVGFQDKWQRAALGFSAVGSEKTSLDRLMQKILSLMEQIDEVQIIDQQWAFL